MPKKHFFGFDKSVEAAQVDGSNPRPVDTAGGVPERI